MSTRFCYGSLSLVLGLVLLSGCGGGGGGDGTTASNTGGATLVTLGRKLFFDESLSSGGNQSCATCHDPASGFADARVSKTAPVSEGSVSGAFGNRNAPTAAYASFSPAFGQVPPADQAGETDSKYRGGQFLDGRRSTLTEQAKDPFLNPVEMNNTDAADVVAKVSNASYAADFISVFGAGAFDNITTAYDNIAQAIAAFEASTELNPFTSKYDAYLQGQYTFTASEARGLELFKGDAKCANCHTLDETRGSLPSNSLFTNFEYYNVGTPSHPDNPAYPAVDEGLGHADATGETGERGKFKVPTLRNIELTAPYMHNGVFETLEEVINHYDLFGSENITPEVDANIANELLDVNQIGLSLDSGPATPNDYTDLIDFLHTLTDGYL